MEDLLKQLKENAKNKFNETIELSINTNIDGKKTDQSIKGALALPNSIDMKRVIMAITDEKNVDADIVGLEDVIQMIKDGKIKHIDRCVTTIDKMNHVKQVASILGKRGLMPNKKFNSLMDNINDAVEHAKNDIYYKSEKSGIIHLIVGKINMKPEAIIENINHVIETIKQSFHDTSVTKIQNRILSAYLSTTQGKKSINIDKYYNYV